MSDHTSGDGARLGSVPQQISAKAPLTEPPVVDLDATQPIDISALLAE